MTVRQHQHESKFYSQLKSMKICIPYREINAAAGANSSAPRCACIIVWVIPAVKGGWAQSCHMLSVTCLSVRSFVCSDDWGVNDKIMEQRKKNLYQDWVLLHDCNDTAFDGLLMELNLVQEKCKWVTIPPVFSCCWCSSASQAFKGCNGEANVLLCIYWCHT